MQLNPVVALLRTIQHGEGSNGHLYALRNSAPDRETYL